MQGLSQYVGAAALCLGLAVKAPDLLRHRREPMVLAITAVFVLGAASFLLGAPSTIAAVNRLSGVPNLAAPLTYSVITAFSASCLVLLVHWRGGPGVRTATRRWIGGYALLVAAIVVLFVLGDAPVERRADLDTYYAATPFIREMVLLYLAGLLTAAAATCVLCRRWAREVRGWVLAGLRLLTAGSAGIAAFALAKLAAVVARWSGRDWAELSTTVAPRAIAVAAVLSAVGYVIPLVGPRLAEGARDWRTYRRLGPLERELAPVLARRALRAPGSCGLSPAALLVCRESSIHNALAHLAPLFDRALHEHTYQAALRATGDRARAEATAWAAVIAAAARTPLTDPAGPGSAGRAGEAAGGTESRGGTDRGRPLRRGEPRPASRGRPPPPGPPCHSTSARPRRPRRRPPPPRPSAARQRAPPPAATRGASWSRATAVPRLETLPLRPSAARQRAPPPAATGGACRSRATAVPRLEMPPRPSAPRCQAAPPPSASRRPPPPSASRRPPPPQGPCRRIRRPQRPCSGTPRRR
ncbi:MAB_1171c family putative transporter [Streptomyces sp. CC228A]|uniref:MAB_1171c family putative transporter n=1 Tax=Streptomyces sp. CC228A TaxID=2898186 RepID=UPI001F38C959|nr:MAB_1171c family putative transporter [Streptomyces sp. CC228A]